MYMSLTILAADQPEDVRSKSRLIRLSNHKNLLPRTKAVIFAAIGLVGLASMVMGAATGGFPWLGYVIVTLLVIWLLDASWKNFAITRQDPLLRCTQAPEQYQFIDAVITDHDIRAVGSGSQSYEVIEATIVYQNSGEEEEMVETFDKSIWNFNRGQYPIPAQVVIDRRNTAQACLVSISKSAIDAMPEGKKRDAGGYAIWFFLAVFFLLLSLFFLAVSLMRLWERFSLRV